MHFTHATSGTGLPVIDLSLNDSQIAKEIRSACLETGFFIVRNHGVSNKLVADTFAQNKAFFDLPLDEKMKISADENFRGYTALREEKVDPASKLGDTKEGLYFGKEMPADHPQPLTGPNQWPSEGLLPGYRKTTEEYIQAVSDLGFRLVQLLALAVELPKTYFDAHFEEPMIYLRPLHYTAEISNEKDGSYGCGAHSDYGMLTILSTSEEDGLQVQSNEDWIDVSPPPDTFVINLGDMMERWTNKLFKSTMHRVMSRGRERYSIPFFYEPAFYTKVECLPHCCSAENPARWGATTAGQHVLDKYAETHAGYSDDTHRKAQG